MDTTGQIIREKRGQKGLLLRELAAELKIDSAIMSKIERGERKPTKDMIIRIAKILELNKENLIIQYLSEKILYEIKDEEFGGKALKVAEQKMKYINKKNS